MPKGLCAEKFRRNERWKFYASSHNSGSAAGNNYLHTIKQSNVCHLFQNGQSQIRSNIIIRQQSLNFFRQFLCDCKLEAWGYDHISRHRFCVLYHLFWNGWPGRTLSSKRTTMVCKSSYSRKKHVWKNLLSKVKNTAFGGEQNTNLCSYFCGKFLF